MTDYQKPTSDKPEGDRPRPKVQKIVTGEVVIPKKTLGEKFADTFFDGQFFKSLFRHAYRDLIVPNAQHVMFDVGKEILLGTIYRNGNVRRVLDPQNLVSQFTMYQTPVSRPGMPGPSSGYPMQQLPMSTSRPAAIDVSQRMSSRNGKVYLCSNKKDAEDTLEAMADIIDSEYKVVSVAEVCEMLGIEFSHADNNYGWFAIGDARITSTSNGFLLELPQPEPL